MEDLSADNINSGEAENPTKDSATTQITLSKDLLKKIAIGAVVGVVVISGILVLTSMKSDSRLQKAVSTCEVADDSAFTLAEDSQSLSFDGAGKSDYSGGNYYDLVCVLEELGAPSTVSERMGRTNSLMGVQDAEWDGIAISWTYHPDNGLDADLEITK